VSKRGAVTTTAIALSLLASPVAAGSGALFGEASRTASFADAVTARPGELSAIYFNPGALADLPRAMVTLSGHVGGLQLFFQRNGESEQDMSRLVGGWGVAAGTPLFGPWWLRAFRFGLALHVPAQHALKLRAPTRPDEPSFLMYGDRAERTALAACLSVRLFDRIGVGAGVSLTPTLNTPTLVSYQPGRGASAEDNVVVDLERELQIEASATFGVRAQVHERLALGFAYRQHVTTSAEGPNDVQAGSLLVDDRIDFYDFLEPDEMALGVAAFPHRDWSLSLDLVRSRWSQYRTIHNVTPRPGLSDVHNLRFGAEHRLLPSLALRFGYAFEPSPLPEQVADNNLLDGDRHVIAVGSGLDLRPLGWGPLRLDGHLRAHVMHSQQADKDVAQLSDADPEQAGTQIGNLGYPGFSAGGYVLEGGLTLTVFLGKSRAGGP